MFSIVDLLQKSGIEVGIDKPSDKIEAECKALTPIAVGFLEDAPDLEGANDVLYGDAETT